MTTYTWRDSRGFEKDFTVVTQEMVDWLTSLDQDDRQRIYDRIFWLSDDHDAWQNIDFGVRAVGAIADRVDGEQYSAGALELFSALVQAGRLLNELRLLVSQLGIEVPRTRKRAPWRR